MPDTAAGLFGGLHHWGSLHPHFRHDDAHTQYARGFAAVERACAHDALCGAGTGGLLARYHLGLGPRVSRKNRACRCGQRVCCRVDVQEEDVRDFQVLGDTAWRDLEHQAGRLYSWFVVLNSPIHVLPLFLAR